MGIFHGKYETLENPPCYIIHVMKGSACESALEDPGSFILIKTPKIWRWLLLCDHHDGEGSRNDHAK